MDRLNNDQITKETSQNPPSTVEPPIFIEFFHLNRFLNSSNVQN